MKMKMKAVCLLLVLVLALSALTTVQASSYDCESMSNVSICLESIFPDLYNPEDFIIYCSETLPPVSYSLEQTIIFYISDCGTMIVMDDDAFYISDCGEIVIIDDYARGPRYLIGANFGFGVSGSNFIFDVILFPIGHTIGVATALFTVRTGTTSHNVSTIASSRFLTGPAYNISHTITISARTGHFSMRLTGVTLINGAISPDVAQTVSFLVNRTGRMWQYDYVCPDTRKANRRPDSNWARGYRETRPSNLRDMYQAYVRARYLPSFMLSSGDDVHHIRPLGLGGTNQTDNLIHLGRPFHQRVSGWFSGY